MRRMRAGRHERARAELRATQQRGHDGREHEKVALGRRDPGRQAGSAPQVALQASPHVTCPVGGHQ
jgi:hypothetical protein